MELPQAQADGLRQLMADVAKAEDRLRVGFSMVVMGHGMLAASNPSLTGTTLTVEVPDVPDA